MIQDAFLREEISNSFATLCGTNRRIANQRKIVATFKPGSAAHRTATEVLLLLLDSAHAIAEARETLDAARRAPPHR